MIKQVGDTVVGESLPFMEVEGCLRLVVFVRQFGEEKIEPPGPFQRQGLGARSSRLASVSPCR